MKVSSPCLWWEVSLPWGRPQRPQVCPVQTWLSLTPSMGLLERLPRWRPPRRYPLHLHPVPGDHRTDRREVWPPSSSLENHSGSPLQGAPANVHPRLLGCKTVIRNTTSRLSQAASTFSFGNSQCYWKRPFETSTVPSKDKALQLTHHNIGTNACLLGQEKRQIFH